MISYLAICSFSVYMLGAVGGVCVCEHMCAYNTSAMHNIIASERSGVECACDGIYAHCELLTRI